MAVATVLLAGGCAPADHGSSGEPDLRPDAAGVYTNHLAAESSPYLQQHAHNPVDWRPWGPDAFALARSEDKPIFLSIGYSSCHWCHVMEAESFSDPATAALINRYFVPVKVDREERPDVERVYLTYLTSVSNAGWPMTLLLTPALTPFFGATYLPPETRGDLEGLREMSTRLGERWRRDRAPLLKAAADGLAIVDDSARLPRAEAAAADTRALDETFTSLARGFDHEHGGFGGANKFPRPVVLTFLLRYYARTGAAAALEMTLATLRAMSAGALHDQLGGGFHRYAVDAAWRVPHFEKMAYDQALIASAYVDAFQLTHDRDLAATARDTLDYVLRDLRAPQGAFYAAEDADSPIEAGSERLVEGAFYVWTPRQFDELLGADAALAASWFGLDPAGAGEQAPDAAGSEAPGTALRRGMREPALARRLGRPVAEVQRSIERARATLLQARALRPRPHRDDKIVAAWNGLLISALARAGAVLDEVAYVDAARRAALFIEQQMFDPATASLTRVSTHGRGGVEALLEDYAFVIHGLLDLYEASHEARWLRLAVQLQATQDRLFWDERDGAYFSTRAEAAHLLARMKEDYDGAEPSANSVSALNLLRLWQLLESDTWRARADATFQALSGRIARSGSAVPQLMSALDFRRSTPKQIVVAGPPGRADTDALLRLVHSRFRPNKVLSLVDGGTGQAELAALVPQLAAMTAKDGRATIYVCENYACRLPTSDLATAERLLDAR